MNEDSASFYTVSGAGGVPLNVREAGNPSGVPIVFLHGLGRCNLDWLPQFESVLADHFRLVAPDLRGHGNSGKPWAHADYRESRTWANDLSAVLDERNLNNPVIVAWSYGGVVVLDYLRECGDERLRGINFVGNVSLVARGIVPKYLSESHKSLNLADNICGNEASVDLLTARDLGGDWRHQALMTAMATPSYVRQAIYTRNDDYTDVMSDIQIPLLVTCGSEDPGYTPGVLNEIDQALPTAAVSLFPSAGHSPFAETPERFNDELHTFAVSLD